MAIAHASLEDVESFERTIRIENERMNEIGSSLSSRLDSAEADINAELSTLGDALSRCVSAISSLSSRISELNEKLAALEAQLAVTPPTILVTYTDSEGNSYTVEEPNPAYLALEAEIGEVSAEINRLQGILEQLESAQYKIEQQIERASTAVRQIGGYRADLSSRMCGLNNYADEALRKLRNIEGALTRYKDTRIQAPDLSVFKPRTTGGSFLDNFKKTHSAPAKAVQSKGTNSQRSVLKYEQKKRGVNVGLTAINEKQVLTAFGMWEKPIIKVAIGRGLEGVKSSLALAKDGERYQIVVRWHATDVGHSFIAFKEGGELKFSDPTYPENNCEEYFNYVDEGDIRYARIDNLNFRAM